MKSLLLFLCIFIVGIVPAYPCDELPSDEFQHFKDCVADWSEYCEIVFQNSINKSCEAKQRREDKQEVKRKFPVCIEITEGK